MKKGIKITLIVAGVVLLTAVPTGVFLFRRFQQNREVEPFNLDDAPEDIQLMQQELQAKLANETFSWDDMEKFRSLAQYIADHDPNIHDMITGWDDQVLFTVEDTGYFWFLIADETATIEYGDSPLADPTISITLDFPTLVKILKQEETPLSAYQKGDLSFEGKFSKVLTIAQITEIASATIMGIETAVFPDAPPFQIRTNQTGEYLPGLTVVQVFNIGINPEYIGEHHKSTVGEGNLYIIDDHGKIQYQLPETAHWVHKFMNATAILMGGQEGQLEIWHFQEDRVETLPVPGGHHAFDYNPDTDTFMVMEYVFSDEIYNGRNVIYDQLTEYDREGNIVWQWDPRIHFPFNETRHEALGLDLVFRGGADWMHANSFVWQKSTDTDVDQDIIYLNVRNLDTILKINYTSKAVEWDAGRGGMFTVRNRTGDEVETIFHYPHSLEYLGNDRFLIYDNDLYNSSNPETMELTNASGHSRFVEFQIDETNHIMQETWQYTPQNASAYYMPESGGDANRLPDGNTMGLFGDRALILNQRTPVYITEVNHNGEIVWELEIPGVNNSYYWVHRVERFYATPISEIHYQNIETETGTLDLNLSVWNNFKMQAQTTGNLTIQVDGTPIHTQALVFQTQWQPTRVQLNLTEIKSDAQEITVIIRNDAGVETEIYLYQREGSSNGIAGFPGLWIMGLGIASVVVLVKQKVITQK